MATPTTAALQAQLDLVLGGRVITITQEVNHSQTGKDSWYCIVNVNWNDNTNTYGFMPGQACWVQTSEAGIVATQAAEIFAGLGGAANRNMSLDPDVFQDN